MTPLCRQTSNVIIDIARAWISNCDRTQRFIRHNCHLLGYFEAQPKGKPASDKNQTTPHYSTIRPPLYALKSNGRYRCPCHSPWTPGGRPDLRSRYYRWRQVQMGSLRGHQANYQSSLSSSTAFNTLARPWPRVLCKCTPVRRSLPQAAQMPVTNARAVPDYPCP